MLKFFNRLEKTRNFVLLIFAILMVGSLVFFYTPARNTYTANLAQSEQTAASVAGALNRPIPSARASMWGGFIRDLQSWPLG